MRRKQKKCRRTRLVVTRPVVLKKKGPHHSTPLPLANPLSTASRATPPVLQEIDNLTLLPPANPLSSAPLPPLFAREGGNVCAFERKAAFLYVQARFLLRAIRGRELVTWCGRLHDTPVDATGYTTNSAGRNMPGGKRSRREQGTGDRGR